MTGLSNDDKHADDRLSDPAAALRLALESHQAGRLEEAAARYREILASEPRDIDALHFLGVVAYQRRQYDEAERLISGALELNDANAPAHNNLGNVFRDQNRIDPALACYRKALALAPDYLDACVNLAGALRAHGALDEAVDCCRKALKTHPTSAALYSTLGNAFHDQGLVDAAIESHRVALTLDPGSAEAHLNLANVLTTAKRLDEAEVHYRASLSAKPDFAPARFAYGLIRLLRGDYESGWPLFESRFEVLSGGAYAGLQARLAALRAVPRWQGDAGRGRRILVWTDQGFGDTLMAMRFIPGLKQRGFAAVTVHCEPALVRVVAALPGVDEAAPISHAGMSETFDCQIPMMSLPLAFAVRPEMLPGKIPYLVVQEATRQAWREVLRDAVRFRVGLAWAGRGDFPRARQRSIDLETLTPVLRIPGIDFISLQKDAAPPAGAPGWNILDYMERCDDLLETAGLVEHLDLVITIDSAVAHLAGALGKPVWMLHRFECEWRWMTGREDSPWYPSLRIFHQDRAGDWGTVIARVAAALQARLAGAPEEGRR
jgi:tetratricopeptide (TPR) repeat protein